MVAKSEFTVYPYPNTIHIHMPPREGLSEFVYKGALDKCSCTESDHGTTGHQVLMVDAVH